MKAYIVCRVIIFASLLVIFVGAILLYFHIVDDRAFAVVAGILAVIVPIAGVFAPKPMEPLDFEAEIYKIKNDLDANLSSRLTQKEALDEYINKISLERLLKRLKTITEAAIITRYQNSGIPALVEELERIEAQLADLNIDYDEIDLPERFKQIITRLRLMDEINAYIEFIAAVPFFGKFMAAPLKVMASRGILTEAFLKYQARQKLDNVADGSASVAVEASSENNTGVESRTADGA